MVIINRSITYEARTIATYSILFVSRFSHHLDLPNCPAPNISIQTQSNTRQTTSYQILTNWTAIEQHPNSVDILDQLKEEPKTDLALETQLLASWFELEWKSWQQVRTITEDLENST